MTILTLIAVSIFMELSGISKLEHFTFWLQKYDETECNLQICIENLKF